MDGEPYHHPKLGPFTINLISIGAPTFGRGDFRIHGNNQSNDASHGCLILDRETRERWWNSEEREFNVVSGE